MVFGILLGPQCADGMVFGDPMGGHGTASAPQPQQDQHVVLAMESAGFGIVMPAGEAPLDLGGVLALCVTLLVAILFTAIGLRPGSGGLLRPRRSSGSIGISPAISASAPRLARLCVLRT